MRTYIILILSLISCSTLFAQSGGGIEQYHYIGPSTNTTIVPVLHMSSKKGWYGEARYNYDEVNTFSLLAGKNFLVGKNNGFAITTMAGLTFGDFDGITIGINTEYEKNGFYFNNQSQYSFSTNNLFDDFAFSWCEIGYQPLNWLHGGFSFQYTKVKNEKSLLEPGLMIGLSFKKISFPLYYFNSLKGDGFFILGINWEWQRD